MSFQNIEVVHVVACDRQRCIGKNNQLPWHIPEDLQHFKRITEHGIVIMGRKTFESMGRPLPRRINWVVTRDTQWQAEGVRVAHTIGDALQQAVWDLEIVEKPSLFVIGGGELFAQTLTLADRLEITHIDLDVQGDVFYPDIPDEFEVNQQSAHQTPEGIGYRFVQYTRRNPVRTE